LSNPNMSEIQPHINQSRALDGPYTNTFLSVLGIACNGKAGETANETTDGVTIRWGSEEDVSLNTLYNR
jgi:hypothetical protein